MARIARRGWGWAVAALWLVLLATPAGAVPTRAQQDREAVEAVLYQAAGALARKDANTLSYLLDQNAVVEVRGMGLDRRVVGRQRLRALYGPDLAQATDPRVEFRDLRVQPQGHTARVDSGLVVWVVPELPQMPGGLTLPQSPLPVPGRLSAQLEKRGHRWVFTRMLLVFPGGMR